MISRRLCTGAGVFQIRLLQSQRLTPPGSLVIGDRPGCPLNDDVTKTFAGCSWSAHRNCWKLARRSSARGLTFLPRSRSVADRSLAPPPATTVRSTAPGPAPFTVTADLRHCYDCHAYLCREILMSEVNVPAKSVFIAKSSLFPARAASCVVVAASQRRQRAGEEKSESLSDDLQPNDVTIRACSPANRQFAVHDARRP